MRAAGQRLDIATISVPAIWTAIGYKPLRWQWENIHQHNERIIVGAAGRRVGKTTAVMAEILREALRPPVMIGSKEHPRIIYVVAPDYELAMRLWEPIEASFAPDNAPLSALKASYDKARKLLILTNGTRIQAKTADNERSLAGEAVTLAVVDEAHAVSDAARDELMPALADSRGRLIAIGVPQSNNWFHSYWLTGQEQDNHDADGNDFWSFSVPSTANPYFCRCAKHGDGSYKHCELEFWRDRLPETRFRQLYLAEWAEAEGQIFRRVDDAFNGPVMGEHSPVFEERTAYNEYGEITSTVQRLTSGPYLMGLDLGKLHDFTVAYVIDIPNMTVVDRLRFNAIDYTVQVERVADLYRKYNCQTINMDVTGVGVPIHEMLRNAGCSISPYVFTNETKATLVSTLASELEHGRVHFMKDDEKLRNELRVYEGTVMPGGQIRYSAPASYYDDCVIAAGLAVLKARKRQINAKSVMRKDYVALGRSDGRPRRP